MYTRFFGLAEKPFAITPDPRYLFLSARHAEALAHLLYGIEDAGGFVQLTGEVGTGKTTMIRSLLGQIPSHVEVALILNPRVTPAEFMHAICDELHLWVPEPARDSVKAQVDILNHYLLDAHGRERRVVLLVDEAQQLSPEVLEQVRLLTNLETATQKLLQIILVGQPELRELVARPELRQLAQRVTGRYHLEPLTREETAAYVRHRLSVAGATNEIFTNGALRELHRIAEGIPRVVNVVADRALLGAYTRDQHRVTAPLVRRAASEVYGRALNPSWLYWGSGVAAVLGAALLAVGGWHALRLVRTAPPGPAAVAAVTAVPAPAPSETAAPSAARIPPPAPKAPELADYLGAHATDTGTDQAFAALFGLWKLRPPAAGARPCEQAASAGLECLAQKGTVAQLRQLNRPAILALVAPDGREHQLVLASLGDSTAQLVSGAGSIEAPLADLERYWYGDYLIFWRPPTGPPHAMRRGMRGEEVRWLREGLAEVNGAAPTLKNSDLYDAELTRQVEEFQRRHRLTVDGIAGVQTQVMLDALVRAPGAPTLRPTGG
jgi:general secretion pathway protein A